MGLDMGSIGDEIGYEIEYRIGDRIKDGLDIELKMGFDIDWRWNDCM